MAEFFGNLLPQVFIDQKDNIHANVNAWYGPYSPEEFGQTTIWVAMPKSWKLKSWVDEGGRGDEMKNDFVQDTIPLEQQTGYAIIGDYKIYQYSILSPVGLRNSFIISAER